MVFSCARISTFPRILECVFLIKHFTSLNFPSINLVRALIGKHGSFPFLIKQLSRVVRKPAFCICENKDADQLRGNRQADQRLCFRYMDSRIPLLPKSEISSLWPSCMAVQTGSCGTWSETPKTGFFRTRLNCPPKSLRCTT